MASPMESDPLRAVLAVFCGALSPAISAATQRGSSLVRSSRLPISDSWEHRDDALGCRVVLATDRVPAAPDPAQGIQPHGRDGALLRHFHRVAGAADAVLVSVPVGPHLQHRYSVDQL